MERFMERNIDSEMFASLQMEEDERLPKRDKGRNGGENKESSVSTSYWGKSLYDKIKDEHLTGVYINPYSTLGKVSEIKPEENIFKKITNWVRENPGKALIAALLVGGGSYLLAKYIRGKYLNNEEEPSQARRRRKKAAVKQVQNNEEVSDASMNAKGIAIGVAAAAGGALVGTMLNDYSVAASIPVIVAGIAKTNIPMITAAVGMFLSRTIWKTLKGEFTDNSENETELEKKGYIKTMLGIFKPKLPLLIT